MKKQFYIPFLILFAVSFVGVSCAASKVPVATCEFEKAFKVTPVTFNANTDGAIVIHPALGYFDALHENALDIRPVFGIVDDEFYRNGYKATLSKAIEEIIAPPDRNKPYCKAPRDGHCSIGVTCNTGFKV